MTYRYFGPSSLFILASLTSCSPKTKVDEYGAVKSTYVHQYGVEVADQTEWQSRGASGQIIKQMKNGATLTQSWQQGKLHGLSTITFPHSNVVQIESFYDNGVRLWLTCNYQSGMPRKQDIYRTDGTIVVSNWYEDGSPRACEVYKGNLLQSGDYFTKDQELETQIMDGTGERIRRDGHGQLVSKDEIENGKLTCRMLYYPSCMPKKYIPFHDGKVQGLVKTFHPAGEPDTIEEWQQGFQQGLTTVFANGQKIAFVPYIQGKKNGIEKRVRPGTDTVVEEISWHEDLKHGPSILYVDNDKVTDYYYNGQKVSRIEFTELDSSQKLSR